MRYTLRLLLPAADFDPEVVTHAGLERVARSAEDHGFDAIAFTEHPAPTAEWLERGGHHSLDPLTALAFVAAHTSRIGLMPHLLVLPYRPALLALKQAVTVDRLSRGRLLLCVGAGYQETEFAALGVDFARRNELFDEAVEVVHHAWSAREIVKNGRYLHAARQGLLPGVQPVAPLWIGGNTERALRRVVAYGQGWTPLLTSAEKAQVTRTTHLRSPADLRDRIERLGELLVTAGRDPQTVPVQVDYGPVLDMSGPAEVVRDAVGRLEEVGATWAVSQPPVRSLTETLEQIQRFGEEVIRSH